MFLVDNKQTSVDYADPDCIPGILVDKLNKVTHR